MKIASLPIGIAASLFLLACGGSEGDPIDGGGHADAAADAPNDAFSDADAAQSDARDDGDAAHPDGGIADPGDLDATSDGDADGSVVDPCEAPKSVVAACGLLVATSGISDLDAQTCVDEMTLLRAAPVQSCFDDGARAAFDETALRVLEAALSRNESNCVSGDISLRMQKLEHFVLTARALTSPVDPVDAAKLVRLDNAFWDGLYWADPRASAFNRTTLRTITSTGLDCARIALETAFDDAGAGTKPPLTNALLVGIAGEALAALDEAYDRTTVSHELLCQYTACTTSELSTASVTWQALAVLDDGAAIDALVDPNNQTQHPVWPRAMGLFAVNHARFEAAVQDALGASAYAPSLLSGAVASTFPGFQSIVSARNHARNALTTFSQVGTYAIGATDSLAAYTANDDFGTFAWRDLNAKYKVYSDARTALTKATNAFNAGTQPSYDVTPVQAAIRDALVLAAGPFANVARVRRPSTFVNLAQPPAVVFTSTALPSQVDPMALDVFETYGPASIDAISLAFEQRIPPPASSFQVVVNFPNPFHVLQPGEPTDPWWNKVSPSEAKALWNAIAAGAPATIALTPADFYRLYGGAAILLCTQAAPVIRAEVLKLEYPVGSVPSLGTISVPFTANESEPFLTELGQFISLRTTLGNNAAGSLPLTFDSVQPPFGPTNLLALNVRNGASPFSPVVLGGAQLRAAIGDTTAPTGLDVMFYLESQNVADASALSWVSTCQP